MVDNNKATIKIELVDDGTGDPKIGFDMEGTIRMLGIALQKTIDRLSEYPEGQAILDELDFKIANKGIINQILNSKGGASNNGR